MAVLDHLPGLEATVTIDTEPLREWADPSHKAGGFTAVNYIEAVPDKFYKVELRFTEVPFYLGGQDLEYHLEIDGHFANSLLVFNSSIRPVRPFPTGLDIWQTYESSEGGGMIGRPFRFSSIISDEDSKDDSDTDSRHIGEITVMIFRAQPLGPVANYPQRIGVGNRHDVSEKKLKGRSISCFTSFGPATPAPGGTCGSLRNPPTPIGTFIFKYRTAADLKIEGIIPRSPSPESSRSEESLIKEESPIQELSIDDLRAAGSRLRKLDAEKAAAHAEKAAAIKREPGTEAVTAAGPEEDDVEPLSRPAKRQRRSKAIKMRDP